MKAAEHQKAAEERWKGAADQLKMKGVEERWKGAEEH
jgi:hypothetical protein